MARRTPLSAGIRTELSSLVQKEGLKKGVTLLQRKWVKDAFFEQKIRKLSE